jgi:hypothetical protein
MMLTYFLTEGSSSTTRETGILGIDDATRQCFKQYCCTQWLFGAEAVSGPPRFSPKRTQLTLGSLGALSGAWGDCGNAGNGVTVFGCRFEEGITECLQRGITIVKLMEEQHEANFSFNP